MCCYSFISFFTSVYIRTALQRLLVTCVCSMWIQRCSPWLWKPWPSSSFSISPGGLCCFLPHICMHAGQSLIYPVDADFKFLTAQDIQHLYPLYYVTVLLMWHLQVLLKINCTVLYVAIKMILLNLKILTTFNPDVIYIYIYELQEEMLHSDRLIPSPFFMYLHFSGCNIGLILDNNTTIFPNEQR